METPAPKIPQSSQDAKSALMDLARLLSRQAAKELVESEQTAPVTPFFKSEGARDD